MATTHTFQSLLNEYLCGSRRLRSGYWQEYKRKAWRLFGVRIKNNPALREAVYARAEKRRNNPNVRRPLLVEEFLKRDFILGMLAKDDQWIGGSLIVPFKPKEPTPSVRFPPPPNAPISDTYSLTYTDIVVKKHVYWKFGRGLEKTKAIHKICDDFVESMKEKISSYMLGKFK